MKQSSFLFAKYDRRCWGWQEEELIYWLIASSGSLPSFLHTFFLSSFWFRGHLLIDIQMPVLLVCQLQLVVDGFIAAQLLQLMESH